MKFGIDKTQFNGIKIGKDGISKEGKTIENFRLTEPRPKDISYAYCIILGSGKGTLQPRAPATPGC